MSLLVITLPARPRLGAQAQAIAGSPARDEWDFVLSLDGRHVTQSGRCAAPLLPRAGQTVAVAPSAMLSYHRIALPKAPAARLRAALGGLLEDALLDEPEGLHLAVAPDARPGEPTWIAACDRAWLTQTLQTLAQQGIAVDRVVPLAAPTVQERPPHLHLGRPDEPWATTAVRGTNPLQLTWCDAQGCASWPAQGALARALLPAAWPEELRCTASPDFAAQAEGWLGRPVELLDDAARLLEACQSGWNLRQFELAARHRGLTALRDLWQRLQGPAWRPVRWGVIGLVAVQLLGLNAWAWMQRHELQQRRGDMLALLRQAHPQVKAVLDAPVQMQRETELLRAAAGRPGPADLETLMAVAASAWPADQPVQTLQYERGQLVLGAPTLGAPELEGAAQVLVRSGWDAQAAAGRLTLRPGDGARRSVPPGSHQPGSPALRAAPPTGQPPRAAQREPR